MERLLIFSVKTQSREEGILRLRLNLTFSRTFNMRGLKLEVSLRKICILTLLELKPMSAFDGLETTTPAGQPIVSREKVNLHIFYFSDLLAKIYQTAPFLIRTFIKIGGFHRLTLFEDGTLPTTDEQQIFTW